MRHSGFRKLFSPPVSTLRVMSLSSVTLSVIFPCQTAVHIMEHWLHSSPLIALSLPLRHNKDIALVNLANVLHRAHFSADAAVVVHAALDDSDFFTSYYTLGNIYAVNTFLLVFMSQTSCCSAPNKKYLFPFLIWSKQGKGDGNVS